MTKISIKKTLYFHKFNVEVANIISNWKIIVPIVFAVMGLFVGTALSKGEGQLCKFLTISIENFLIDGTYTETYSVGVIYLLIPTFFAFLLFFCGLSVYGGLVSNFLIISYSMMIGFVSYYFYSNYSLKGLAYCVIIIFPYAILTRFSVILITGECINMSQVLTKNLSKNLRGNEYNFKFYYKNCMKSYCFIILGTVIKMIIDSLFIGLFNF